MTPRAPSRHLRQPGRQPSEAAQAGQEHEDSEGRRRRRGLRAPRRSSRRALCDADPAPQPDRAVHHHLRLERRPADDLRAEPVRVRAARTALAEQLGIEPERRPRGLALRRRRLRLARARSRRARRSIAIAAAQARPAGQAGGHPRPGLHHRHLPRRDAPPRAARRDARRQADGAHPRGLGGHLAARRTTTVAGTETTARHVRLPRTSRRKVHDRPRRPQHARLHARAARDALHVRAGKRDGRAGRTRWTWTRSSCAASTTRRREPIKGLPYLQPLADAVLRPGRGRVRLGEPQSRAGLDARRRLAGRLGLRHRLLPDQYRRRRPRGCALTPDGKAQVADWRRTRSAPAPTPSWRMTRGRAARRAARGGHGRDGRQRPAARAGGRRLEPRPPASCTVVAKACDDARIACGRGRATARSRRRSGHAALATASATAGQRAAAKRGARMRPEVYAENMPEGLPPERAGRSSTRASAA